MKLLDPQIPHAHALIDSIYLNGIAADLSETGCGKTYVATYVAKTMNVPTVVICPKAVIPVWKRVMASANVSAMLFINYEKLMRGNTKYLTYDVAKLKVVNMPTWQSMIVNLPKNCLIILDEVHKCKGTKSLNGAFLTACKSFGYKMLVMSASAATNPLEMRHFGYATNLHNWVNFRKWCGTIGAEESDRYDGMTIDLKSQKVMDGMRWVHDQLFNVQRIASRLTRDQMKAMFPENRVVADCFDMGSNTAKIQAVYDHMEAEIARLDERSNTYRAHVFAEIMKARRMAEILKVPTLVEMIQDMYEEGISPVVFINFEDTMEALQKRLASYGDLVGVIKGGQSAKERQRHIDEFQSNTRRIMLVNLAAGNAGISLHDLDGNFPRHSLVCPSFSAINLIQALGRIHRAEGKSPCLQKIVFAANTIEERCCERVQTKLDNLDILNDGDLVGDIQVW